MDNLVGRHTKLPAKKEWGVWKQILMYSLLFLIAAAGAYAFVIISQKTLLRNGTGNVDGITQYYPSYAKIKNVFHTWLHGGGIDGWSWDVGLGASFFDTFKGKLVSALTYLIIAPPQKYMDIAYSVVTVFRQYLTGIAFILFGREVRLKADQNVFGAFCYAFSGWAFRASIAQGSFTNAMIFLPILILGVERMLRKKSPLVFIIAEVLFLSSNILWSYIAGITCILFFVMRYLYYYGRNGELREPEAEIAAASGKKFRLFPRMFAELIGSGIIGILISSIFLESMLVSTTSAITNTNYDVYRGVFYPLKKYILMPSRLFTYSEVHTSYSFVFATVLVAMLLPLVVINVRKRRSTASILTLFFMIIGLFPYTGKVLNGFSYSVGRWYFVLIFFYVWAAMECFDHEILRQRKTFLILFGWWFLLAVWILGFCMFVMRMLSHNNAWQSLIGLALAFILLVILYLREFRCGADEARRPKRYGAMNALIAALLIVNVSMNAYIVFAGISDDDEESGGEPMIESFADAGWADKAFTHSVQRVVQKLQDEDKSFFRTDQVDGYNDVRRVRVMANENIYFGNRSIYEYFSSISADWLKFNKTVGNNAGYFRRTVSYSNDNRPGLDYLMGVKYFLGDSKDRDPGASRYCPYGYDYYKSIDGVKVYRNRYCMGLGTNYSQYITESELRKFSELEREQILMQAVVIPDDETDQVRGIRHADVDNLQTDVEEVACTIKDPYGVKTMAGTDGGQMVLTPEDSDEGSGFTLEIPVVRNCMLVVSFDNLNRKRLTWNDHMKLVGKTRSDYKFNDFKYYLNKSDYYGDESFRLTASYDGIEKSALSNRGQNQGLSDVRDFNLNLGYFDKAGGDIKINFNSYGIYNYDSIKVYAIPMDIYAENAKALDSTKFNVTSFDGDTVKGTVDPGENSVLYLSILDDPGWKVYVDGKEADKIDDVNIAFTGVRIPKGSHKVVLEYHYPGLKAGLAATAAGIVLLIIVMIRFRKKRITRV